MSQPTKIQEGLYYDERSAGGLVYRIEDGKVLWLVINFLAKARVVRSNDRLVKPKNKTVYKFPKGHLQKNEFLKQAALREVEEEGKVKARIVTKIGSNDYVIWDKLSKKKIIKKVSFFLMEYLGESSLKYYDDETVLGREWLLYDEAGAKLAYDSEKILLKRARSILERLGKRK